MPVALGSAGVWALAEDLFGRLEALAAIRDALDRAALGAKQAVDVAVGLRPYEHLLNDNGVNQLIGSRTPTP